MKKSGNGIRPRLLMAVIVMVFLPCSTALADAHASESVIDIGQLKQAVDTIWVLSAAFLVFFMQAGFGMVEVTSSSVAGYFGFDIVCKRDTPSPIPTGNSVFDIILSYSRSTQTVHAGIFRCLFEVYA